MPDMLFVVGQKNEESTLLYEKSAVRLGVGGTPGATRQANRILRCGDRESLSQGWHPYAIARLMGEKGGW